jgi:uncharacterized Ntn-hydrolase superfamily protein
MERVRTAVPGWIGALALVAAALAAPCAASGPAVPTAATFSIVAADTVEHEWGVAVSSRILAVGSIVPYGAAGVGAVATQAAANPAFGPQGLAFMERGSPAADALKRILRTDRDNRIRQLALIDARGEVAVYTGDGCEQWAGSIQGEAFSVQGNFLAGPSVLDAMARAYRETEGSLAERLIAALAAGEEEGGDSRGKQSAAVLVVKAGGGYGGGNDRLVDLRVDDDPAPVAELARLYRLHAAYYLPAVHVRLGDQYLAAKDREHAEREYAQVIHLYRDAIAAFPQDARLPNGLAWFYVRHRVNLDEALRLADGAHHLDPRSWEVEDTLAEIYFARGQVKLARDHAKAALALAPKNPYLESQASRFAEAVEMLERR